MLNSIHDISPNIDSENSIFKFSKSTNNEFDNTYLDSITIENFYPYKLVGGKSNHSKLGTIVIFTILGKRDGHEKPVQELLLNNELLEKFHPTEAIKLGFIFLGESLFNTQKKD